MIEPLDKIQAAIRECEEAGYFHTAVRLRELLEYVHRHQAQELAGDKTIPPGFLHRPVLRQQ